MLNFYTSTGQIYLIPTKILCHIVINQNGLIQLYQSAQKYFYYLFKSHDIPYYFYISCKQKFHLHRTHIFTAGKFPAKNSSYIDLEVFIGNSNKKTNKFLYKCRSKKYQQPKHRGYIYIKKVI